MKNVQYSSPYFPSRSIIQIAVVVVGVAAVVVIVAVIIVTDAIFNKVDTLLSHTGHFLHCALAKNMFLLGIFQKKLCSLPHFFFMAIRNQKLHDCRFCFSDETKKP